MTVAVYPGTFDPFTRGHEDLVRRASSIFTRLIVGVADSKNKRPIFIFDPIGSVSIHFWYVCP